MAWTCPCSTQNDDATIVCGCGRGRLHPKAHLEHWTPMHQSFDEFRNEDLADRILPALKWLETNGRPGMLLRVARALVYARAMVGYAAKHKIAVDGLAVRWAVAFHQTGKLKPVPRTTYVGQSGEAKALPPPIRQYSALFARQYISALPGGKELAGTVSGILFGMGGKGSSKAGYTPEQKIVHDAYKLDKLRDPSKAFEPNELLFLGGGDRTGLIETAKYFVQKTPKQPVDEPVGWLMSQVRPELHWLNTMLQEENEVSLGRRLKAGDLPDPMDVPDSDMEKWFKSNFSSQKKSWMDIRRMYISKYDADSPRRMLKMQAFRARIVDGLLDKLVNEQTKETGGHLRFTSTGSNNLTSDYDVQLYDDGQLKGFAGSVIAKFNETFRSRWGLEAGTAFDTNVYDPGFLPREDATENPEVRDSEKRIAAANAAVQDAGALAKICKFMTDAQWRQFRRRLVAAIPNLDKRPIADRQLEAATKMIERYHAAIAAKRTDKGFPDDDELRAKNIVYAEKLAAVNEHRLRQGELNKEIVELKRENPPTAQTRTRLEQKRAALDEETKLVHALFVEASVWAHEAYHTEGPLMDVVYNQQEAFKGVFEYSRTWDPKTGLPKGWGERRARGKHTLSEMEMLESLNEQFGDALKDIEHYSHPSEENPDPFAKTAVQTSKYLKRLFSIAETLKEELDPNEKKLKEINSRPETGLLALRASSKPPPPELLAELRRETGIREPDDYVRVLTNLAVRVNGNVRARF